MRKTIVVDEGIKDVGNIIGQKKVMRDIMYYLRKLLKLARRASVLGLSEGMELDSIEEEFNRLKEEIDRG